ncbi:heliorhodopsin HeR [Candidatus Dojkabacteria bacterium]|nr:heliorhodopsin HeR [Candidatus Dojkabacteria bacterium]
MDETKFRNLRIFNGIMAILHFAQGVLMLVLSNGFSLPITTSYLDYDSFQNSVAPNAVEVASLQIGPVVAGFLFISALAHLLLTLPVVYEWYVENLKKKINYLRWYEYAFSSSLMIVIIAMLSGMYDLSSLILIFTLNAMMIFFGLIMEVHNQTTKKTNWLSFVFGCIAGIVPWIVIAMYFYGALNNYSDSVPTFVYGILISLFLFFNIFAINMFLQYKKIGPWRNYLFGERMYIVLSLLAKSALAWQVFSGTLRG